MKRKTLILTAAAAAIAIGAATFLPAYAHGPGSGMGWGGGPGYGMGMGQGMMGQGFGPGQHAYGPGGCPGVAALGAELTVDTVTKFLEARLAHWGNPRLKVGKVEAADDKTITAEIVTKDGSLVEKFTFDKATGWPRRVN